MKISKTSDFDFRTECALIITHKNGVLIEGVSIYDTYRITGVNNSIDIILFPNVDSAIFSVFCKFEKPIAEMGNPYSGKHNFHTSSEKHTAVKEFGIFLNQAVNKLD